MPPIYRGLTLAIRGADEQSEEGTEQRRCSALTSIAGLDACSGTRVNECGRLGYIDLRPNDQVLISNKLGNFFDVQYRKVTVPLIERRTEKRFQAIAVRIKTRNPVYEVDVAQPVSMDVHENREHSVQVHRTL